MRGLRSRRRLRPPLSQALRKRRGNSTPLLPRTRSSIAAALRDAQHVHTHERCPRPRRPSPPPLPLSRLTGYRSGIAACDLARAEAAVRSRPHLARDVAGGSWMRQQRLVWPANCLAVAPGATAERAVASVVLGARAYAAVQHTAGGLAGAGSAGRSVRQVTFCWAAGVALACVDLTWSSGRRTTKF